MPIQIKNAKSLHEVEQSIRAYEKQFNIPSESFVSDMERRATVPEFDAIEWDFLLMQRAAMQEDDDACGGFVIWSSYESSIKEVDPASIYGKIAA